MKVCKLLEETTCVRNWTRYMIPNRWRIGPVSYTHLDVYKRQSRRFRLKPRTALVREMLSWADSGTASCRVGHLSGSVNLPMPAEAFAAARLELNR